MPNTYAKVPHTEYLDLIKRCETLEKENARLKEDLKKATSKSVAKVEVKPDEIIEKNEKKTETKKGGNK